MWVHDRNLISIAFCEFLLNYNGLQTIDTEKGESLADWCSSADIARPSPSNYLVLRLENEKKNEMLSRTNKKKLEVGKGKPSGV